MKHLKVSPVFLVIVLAIALSSPLHVSAQDAQEVAASKAEPAPTWSIQAYAGTAVVVTRGERREYVTARATVSGKVLGPLSAFARGDLTGAQDGGALEPGNLESFRTIEVAGGLRYKVRGDLSVVAIAGWTYSVEGENGKPADPRLYTIAAMGRLEVGDGGYVYLGGGHHGPVGGPALLVAASIPVRAGSFAVADFALPLRTVADRTTWVLKIGASVRVKTIGLGF